MDSNNMLNVNCWILGDDPRYIFIVKIANSEMVEGLKTAIKNKRDQTFDGVETVRLNLWKVNITDLDSINRIDEKDYNIPGELLQPLKKLSVIFTDRPDHGSIHIIVECSDESDQHRAKRARIQGSQVPDVDLLNLRNHFWHGGEDSFVKHSVKIPDQLSLEVKDASEPLTLTVIEHPGGEFRFGDSKLIVREIFETFRSLLESEDAEWQKLVQSPGVARRFHYPHHATIITGQPGIGKTVFLTYVLLFRMTLGKTTIYCDTESHAHIFDDKGVRKMSLLNGYRFPELETDPGCCALVNISDKLKSVPETFYPSLRKGRVVVASSLDSTHWRSFAHEWPARICCMPTWSWETLYFGSLLVNRKGFPKQGNMKHCKSLQHAYSIFRGIPRLCYRALEGGLDRELESITDALHNITTMDDFSRATRGVIPFDYSTSHRLVRVEPIDNEWRKTRTELLSDYVAELVFNRIHMHNKVQLSETLVRYLADPDDRGKGGTLFEHAAHFVIRKGCNLMTTLLSPQSGKDKMVGIFVPAVQDYNKSRYFSLAIWEAPGSQSVHPNFLDLYMTPISKTEPSIDALFISKHYITFLFQMTVSDHHPVKFQGLNRVVSQLPAKAQKDIRIVFITPTQPRDTLGREFQGIQSTQAIDFPQSADPDKVKKFKLFPQYVCQLDINGT